MSKNKLIRVTVPYHVWSLGVQPKLKAPFMYVCFMMASLVIGTFTIFGIARSQNGWEGVAYYITLLVMAISFGMSFIALLCEMINFAVQCYHVTRANVDEQKCIDLGHSISYFDPETKKVYSEKAVWDGIKNEAYKTRRLDADVAVMEAEQKRYTSPKTNEPANC